ncbi:hypothetical protein V1511DRAFT_531088 [Dipodascopsis uninucleata]
MNAILRSQARAMCLRGISDPRPTAIIGISNRLTSIIGRSRYLSSKSSTNSSDEKRSPHVEFYSIYFLPLLKVLGITGVTYAVLYLAKLNLLEEEPTTSSKLDSELLVEVLGIETWSRLRPEFDCIPDRSIDANSLTKKENMEETQWKKISNFYLVVCGHVFCERHIGIDNIVSKRVMLWAADARFLVDQKALPRNHICPHCSATHLQVYSLSEPVPPDIAIYFNDHNLLIDKTVVALRYQLGTMIYLINHYQKQERDYLRLKNEVDYQSMILRKVKSTLEKSAHWKKENERLNRENEELRSKLDLRNTKSRIQVNGNASNSAPPTIVNLPHDSNRHITDLSSACDYFGSSSQRRLMCKYRGSSVVTNDSLMSAESSSNDSRIIQHSVLESTPKRQHLKCASSSASNNHRMNFTGQKRANIHLTVEDPIQKRSITKSAFDKLTMPFVSRYGDTATEHTSQSSSIASCLLKRAEMTQSSNDYENYETSIPIYTLSADMVHSPSAHASHPMQRRFSFSDEAPFTENIPQAVSIERLNERKSPYPHAQLHPITHCPSFNTTETLPQTSLVSPTSCIQLNPLANTLSQNIPKVTTRRNSPRSWKASTKKIHLSRRAPLNASSRIFPNISSNVNSRDY